MQPVAFNIFLLFNATGCSKSHDDAARSDDYDQRNGFVHNILRPKWRSENSQSRAPTRSGDVFWLKLFPASDTILQFRKILDPSQLILEKSLSRDCSGSIAQIRGSENRSHEFDEAVYPLYGYSEERWQAQASLTPCFEIRPSRRWN